MTYTRDLPATVAGPVHLVLDIPIATISVVVGAFPRLAVTLSTTGDEASEAAKAIRAATAHAEQRKVEVRVPHPSGPSGSGHTTAMFNNIVVGSNATVYQSAGDMNFRNGVPVSNGDTVMSSAVHHGITVRIRLPKGSGLTAETSTASLTTTGPLEWVRFTSQTGSLSADLAKKVDASTNVGNIAVGLADEVTATTNTGHVRVEELCGGATLRSQTGNVTAHCTRPGRVTAHSNTGNVDITADGAAAVPGALDVSARSNTGSVRVPQTSSGPRTSRQRPTDW